MNNNALIFFQNMSQNNCSQNSVKLANNSDFSHIDAELILKYTNRNSSICDLGSGTGLIINKIYNFVGNIVAVEIFKDFTKYIVESPNIEIVNKHILQYEPQKQFDIVTAFGTMHYFDESDATQIYKKYFNYLKSNGMIIIKNQFGVKEDVSVSGYSTEQKTNYYAQYHHIDKEVIILENVGFKNINVIDIYPPECNRWNNTHFYAIIASKLKIM